MCKVVQSLYQDEERFKRNANLLWIRRRKEQIYVVPSGEGSRDASISGSGVSEEGDLVNETELLDEEGIEGIVDD
jgi:hypothetical protein